MATRLSQVWLGQMNEGPSAKNGEGQTTGGPKQGWRELKDNDKDGWTTCSARKQNTPPLQALEGVRVVASLLGHSRLGALCSRAIKQVGQ